MQTQYDEYNELPTRWEMFRARLWLATVYRVRYEWPEKIQIWVPRHLPRWLVYRTTLMAYSRAWQEAGDKHPDELTFSEVVKPWERAR